MNDNRRTRTMRNSKPYRDDSKELIGTLGALIIVGLGMAIKKAVTSIVKRKAASNKENEILRAIRSGEINEQYFTREMKAQIVMSIDRLFNQGALDAFFESNHIDPTKQKAYVNKIKNGVKKCQTLQQIIDFLNADSSFVLPTYFDGLETMNRLFQKAKMMKDSKIKDDNTDFALKIIDKTQSIVKKLNYPVVTSYLAKIKNAVIGGNESALNNAVGNVIDFFASKEFEAQNKDKDLKKANLLKVARETINELYGLPIRRDSRPCKIITHDSMPWANINATRKRRNLDAAIKRYIDRAEKAKKVQNELKKKIINDGLGPVTKQVLSSVGKRAKSIAKKTAKPLALAAIFAAAIYAAGRRAKKLTEKYSFRNRVIRGEITEQDAVRDASYHIADELEEQLNVKFNLIWDPDEELNDEEKKKYYEEKKKLDALIKRIRNARTFAELRKYADSQWIDDIENEYKNAVKERNEMIKKGTKTMKKTDRAIRSFNVITHDSMPWAR